MRPREARAGSGESGALVITGLGACAPPQGLHTELWKAEGEHPAVQRGRPHNPSRLRPSSRASTRRLALPEVRRALPRSRAAAVRPGPPRRRRPRLGPGHLVLGLRPGGPGPLPLDGEARGVPLHHALHVPLPEYLPVGVRHCEADLEALATVEVGQPPLEVWQGGDVHLGPEVGPSVRVAGHVRDGELLAAHEPPLAQLPVQDREEAL
mmetsp:Transcript_11003/g.37453  ORF Transcript_11003/g.37453 Transcript_11003/m.37453 type:complete len:209 (-) Transcript_11003:511-1137(-)